jgi:hypothetical protein
MLGDKWTMASVGEYGGHAAQCLSLAQNTESPEDRTRLLQMAEARRELAHKTKIDNAPQENKNPRQ